MNNLSKRAYLYDNAACVGTDPLIFDDVDLKRSGIAVAICRRCNVRELCLEIVEPEKNYYDGTVGGRVWRLGKDITLRSTVRDFNLIPLEPADDVEQRQEQLTQQDELIASCSGCGAWTFGSTTCAVCN